jgi:hypothetical protein
VTSNPTWWGLLQGASRRQIDNAPVGSPLWWVLRLEARIAADRPELELLERYYAGDFPLSATIRDPQVRAKFAALIEQAKANYMELVVDAAAERCIVQGFRQVGDTVVDDAAWRIWSVNDMDAWQSTLFTEAFAKKRAYLSVGSDDGATARIEVEDATQCFVEFEPGSRQSRAAGAKFWVDDWTGATYATLYLPDSIHYLEESDRGWVEREPEADNPWGVVPLIPVVNRPSLSSFETGFSEIGNLIPSQDRINETLLNRMIAAHFGAFMQKWATGLDILEDENGDPIPPFKPGVDQLFIGNDGTKFGEFSATDLANYIKSIASDVEHIAVISRTPRHYLTASGQSPSGDAIRSAEAGLVAKVNNRQKSFGVAIREAMTLALQVEGVNDVTLDVVWSDPSFRTLGELTDAVIKQSAADLPAWALERIGYAPDEIRRIQAEQMQRALLSPLNEAVSVGVADVADEFDVVDVVDG